MWSAFDVDAVVAALPAGDVAVVAGADGLTRSVRRARLVPEAGAVDDAGLGDLLLTTVEALRRAGAADDVVARLHAAGVAGVAVRLDRAEPVGDDVRAAADRTGLPVITFAEGSDLADVADAVLDALLAAQRRRLDHVLDIHHRFTEIVLAGGGTPRIAATLHDLLGCPVAVLDAEGRPTVVVPDGQEATLDLGAPSAVHQRIRAGEQDYGEIVVLPGRAGLGDDGRVAVERAATAVAVRLAQATAVAEAEERFAAISLEELVAGHPGTVADVTERAVSFGWDLARPRAVLLASIDPPAGDAIPPSALGTIAAAARATLGPDAIVWTRTATIAALLAPATDDAAERRRIAEGLRRELDQRLRSVAVSIGVGRRVGSPASLPRSFAEASRAVEVGRWAKGRHVTEVFDQLGLERLLAATPMDDLVEFVQGAIGPLVRHDRQHRTALVDTLSVWLETRNMAEAARRMHVHVNTLRNRLERIEEILGPIQADAARALECEVAIYVDRHYDVAWDDGAPRP